jgi:hypothetical protein
MFFIWRSQLAILEAPGSAYMAVPLSSLSGGIFSIEY